MQHKTEYRKSELLSMIRGMFYEFENDCSDIDRGYFRNEDISSFYEFLISKHKDEWTVIDDTGEGGNYEGTF